MKDVKTDSKLLTSYSQGFSVAIFLLVLIVGSVAFMLSMRHNVRAGKQATIGKLLENSRIAITATVEAEIKLAVKMANSPLIKRYFSNPISAYQTDAFEEIADYRNAFASQNVFWINDTDKKFYFNGEHLYTLDPNNPSSDWYITTLAQERAYNVTVDYDIGLQKTMLWINATVKSGGKPIGVMGTSIDMSFFYNKIYKASMENADLYFINDRGEITVARDSMLAFTNTRVNDHFGEAGQTISNAARNLQDNEIHMMRTPIGEIGICKIPELDWYAFAVIPNRMSYYITSMTWLFITMLAILGGVLIVLNVFVIKAEIKNVTGERERAQAQNKAKSDFLAKMSHEMRTPMSAIIGMSDIALRKEMPQSVRDDIKTIRSAGTSLLMLINDILDLSKIESGKLEIIPGKYELSSLLNDVINIIKIKIEDTGLSFNADIGDNIPNNLTGDSVRIRQILINILTNAVKYTNEGSVSFTVRGKVSDDGDDVTLSFEIADTGKGIKESDIKKLFGDFVQVDTKTNHGIEGTGLGLSIAKNLAKAMGGDITVKSVYGKGSTFTITLPQKIRSKEAAALSFSGLNQTLQNMPAETFTAPDARVLVVDDIVTNIKVAVGLLEPYGMIVDTATNGMDAIALVKTNRYDMILMDHMMPGIDGTETVRRIRETGKTEEQHRHLENTPIIALTANAIAGAKEMFLQNGFSDFLSKPIDVIKLNGILEYWIPNEKKIIGRHVAYADDTIDISDIRIPGIDINLGLTRNGGKVFGYLSTLDVFCFDIQMKIDEIANTLLNNNLSLYTIYVHALKSALANIGAAELSDLAKELEDAGNRKDRAFIDEHTNDLLSRLKLLLENVTEALRTIKAKRDQTHVVDAGALESILASLRSAIDNLDPANIGSAIKMLEPFENSSGASVSIDTKAKIKTLRLHVLNGEYDEAVALINGF